MNEKIPKVVIVGAGFGGLNAAKALGKASVELLLLDKTNHHLFQPLLYQVATAALSPANIALATREILSNQKNTTVLLAEVSAIDKEKREVVTSSGEVYSYDYLILAPGSRHAYFGHPEWENLTQGLKTLDDALRIREHILLSYERAERFYYMAESSKFVCFAIVGAGPTGVEMAGAIAEIAQKSLTRNFRHIDPKSTKIYLIEGESQVLPSFPKSLAEDALKDLEKLGVTVLLNTYVTDITAQGIQAGNHFIETSNVIWAAGNEAAPLLKTLGVPLDRYGRVMVNPDLSVPGFPDVFVIGDAAFLPDREGKPLPGIAPVAIQQGRYVARLIKSNLKGSERKAFAYFDKGMLATIGKNKAVGVYKNLKFSGYLAYLTWCFVHIFYLISFPNRLLVLIQWVFLYFSNQRRIRLITSPVTDKDDEI